MTGNRGTRTMTGDLLIFQSPDLDVKTTRDAERLLFNAGDWQLGAAGELTRDEVAQLHQALGEWLIEQE